MAASDLQFDITALDRASKVFVKLAAAAEKVEKKLDDLDGKRVSTEVDVDTRKAEAKLGKFATDARRRIDTALKALPEVELTADSSDLDRDMARIRNELEALQGQRIGIDIDSAKFDAEMRRLTSELQRVGRESPDIQVQTDTAAAISALGVVDAAAGKLDGKNVRIKVDVDKSLSDSLIKVAQLGRALGALALPAAAIAAAPQLASLGAAAVSASGALALIPAAGFAAAAGVGAVTLGLQGFSDALGDSPKKAQEALAKMSPAARELVGVIKSLGPAWREVQNAAQTALVTGMAAPIRQLSASYLPILKTAFVGINTAVNSAAKEFATFATSAQTTQDAASGLSFIQTAAKSLGPILVSVSAMFRDIGVVGAAFLPELARGFAGAADRAADFIHRARESGELGKFIQRGIDTVAKLGATLGNVGAIAYSVFSAAEQAGAGFVDTLAEVTTKVREFVTSAEGNAALVGFFTTIRETVAAVKPGVIELGKAIAGFAADIGGSGVLQSAGAALSSIASSAAPVVEVLGELGANVLPPLLSVVEALAPALVPLAIGLAAIKLASLGYQKVTGFPSWLMSVKQGSEEAARSNAGLQRVMGGVAAPFRAAGTAVRGFRDEMALQTKLAEGYGYNLTKAQAASAAFEASQSSALTAVRGLRDEMVSSYQRTSTAVQGFADSAGKAANTATVALGERLAKGAQRGVDSILAFPGAVKQAASALSTGLQTAVNRAGLELEALPGRAREAASTLKTALGVAVIDAGDKLKDLGVKAKDAGATIKTGIGVAAIDAGEKLKTIGTSAAEAGRSLVTGLQNGVASAATTLRQLPTVVADVARALPSQLAAGAQSAGRAISDGVRTGVTAAGDAVKALPGIVSSAASSAAQAAGNGFRAVGTSVSNGLRSIPDGIRNAFSTIGSAVDGGLSHLGRFASSAAGAASAAGTAITNGLRSGMSGLLGALGGPWGLLITAATVALGIVGAKQAEAKQAAADHKAAVDELAGSFDKVSGAASAATRAIQAQELTSVKLTDGTTSLATALGTLGVSTQDWVDATTGNIPKQQMIAEKLNATTKAAIENSDVWKNNGTEVTRWGVSMDTVVAAANGNTTALQQLKDAAKQNAGGVLENEAANSMLVESLLRLGGTSGEVSSQFGAALGKFNDAKTQFDTVKQATADFTEGLKSLGNEGARVFAALAAGAPVTKEMAAALTATGQGAVQMSLEVGRATSAVSGVEQGAIGARDKMAGLRQQFIDAATAAGMGVPQAEALANSYGLIPSAVETIIRTNATGVAAEMITLGAQIQAVPPGKDVIVNALTDEAKAKLEAMGFQVQQLPDGTFRILGNDDDARAKLAALVANGNAAIATMKLNADPAGANGTTTATLTFMNGSTGTVTLAANGAPATAVLNGTKYNIDTTTGVMTIDGDPAPGQADLSGLKVSVDRTTGTLTILGRDGGVAALKSTLSQPSSSIHTIYVRQAVTRVVSTAPNDPRNVPGRATPAGGGVFGYAGGGVHGFAGGGIRASRRRGMVVPGYAPGRDDVDAVISKGESVLVPELTRLLGARRILAANAEASGGRPATMVGQLASIMDGTIPRSPGILAMTADRMGWALTPKAGGDPYMTQIRRGMMPPAALPSSVTGAMSQVRAAVGTPRGGAPAGGIQLGPLLGLLQQQVGQTRALRGDVMSAGQWSQLIAAVQSLAAARGGNPAATTGAARTLTETGAF